MDPVDQANTILGLHLLKKLSEEDPKKSLFFSPSSIGSALQMVFWGARGYTEAQLSQVLSMTKDEDIKKGYEKLISELNKPGTKNLLKLVNRLYGDTSYDFLPSFTDTCQKFFHSNVVTINFRTDAEESRTRINEWVAENTAGKIQHLLAPGLINHLTRMVLVNAVYFKGNWASKFLKVRTEEKPFKISKKETKMVQMMHKKAQYNMSYIAEYQSKVLEIPYVDNELSMIILLPDKIEDNSTGLEKLQRDMTFAKLMDWLHPQMMELTEIELSLPRFKLEENYNLKPILHKLGIIDAFDENKADFSGMTSNKKLFISEFFHKCFLEVNEEGSEAASSTAGIMMGRSAKVTPKFMADHPFFFFIRHNGSRNILFFGKCCSP